VNHPSDDSVKVAQRAPKGSLDGHWFDTLGHAVQDDTAACTACEARFGFSVWGLFSVTQ
jgi:hypothetical protein